MTKFLRWPILALVGALCSGCIDSTTIVTVRKDGSGTIEESVYVSKAVQQMMEQMTAAIGGGKKEEPKTPKIDEDKLRVKAARMGEGVTFVSAKEDIKDDGTKGTREVYAFSDVRKLRLQSDPDTSAIGGSGGAGAGPGQPGGAPKAKKKVSPPVTFGFRPGGTSTLTIRMPEPKRGKTEDKPGDAVSPKKPEPSPQEMAMMKKMFDGFRFRMIVEVDGEITKTNASYVRKGKDGRKQSVTLFDMNIGELMKDETAFKKMTSLGKIQDMATAKTVLQGIPGLEMETEREVSVSFR